MRKDICKQMRLILIFIMVLLSNQVDSLVKKSTIKKKITPSLKINKRNDDPKTPSLSSNRQIIPAPKGSQGLIYKIAMVSSKAAVTAARLTSGTVKSSVDLLVGNMTAVR